MILRPMEPADRAAVNALACQVHDLHAAWRPDIYRAAAEFYNEAGFARFMEEKTLYVLELEGEIAAYVRFELRDIQHRLLALRKVLYIEELCVAQGLRHQGLGRTLMTELKQIALDRGCTDMELSAVPQNEPALRLYETLGFTVRHINYQMKL